MTYRHIAIVWTLTQAMRLAWAIIRAAQKLGCAGEHIGERLEARVEAAARGRGVDISDMLEPLTDLINAA
jgi:hypothetical protein